MGNPFAAMTVIVLIAILFMGFWVAIPVYNSLSNILLDNSHYENMDESACSRAGAYWENGACGKIPEKATNIISQQRRAWLAAPIIFAISMIIWFWTKTFNKDVQTYGGPPQ